jgi:hypothetical protein
MQRREINTMKKCIKLVINKNYVEMHSQQNIKFCRTILLRNNVANVGIKLYNKLPEKLKKLEKIEEFKR